MKGRNVCYYHGGKSKRGMASPSFQDGRWSKHLPKLLSEDFSQFQVDPELLSLREDVALLRSLTAKYLKESEKGFGHPVWLEMKEAFQALETASDNGDLDLFMKARQNVRRLIEPHYRATIAEQKAVNFLEKTANMADKERRMLLDLHQVITVEQSTYFFENFLKDIFRIVNDHSDTKQAKRILLEIQGSFDRLTGYSEANPRIIDAS